MAVSCCNTETDERGRELKRHGTALFPIACYHDNLTTEPVPWHWHDELEVGIVTEGEVLVAAGDLKYILTRGDGFFINSGVLHGAWNKGASPCRLHSLVFHPRLVGGSMDSIFWQRYLLPLLENQAFRGFFIRADSRTEAASLEFIETAWQACADEPPGYEFLVRNALSGLIFHMGRHLPAVSALPSGKAVRNETRIKLMLTYIKEHFSEELSIEDIAASAAISPSECLRCFKATINITPIQYVKQFRIQKAAELLLSTDRKITDIGSLCGFQEMSYFAKSFRELKGMTPTEYRAQKP